MNLLILTAESVQDEELFYPYYLLQNLASLKEAPNKGRLYVGLSPYKNNLQAKTKAGTFIPWTSLTKDLKDINFDLIIIPGGFAPETMRCDESVLEIVKKTIDNNGVIGAICHGPQVLLSLVAKYGKIDQLGSHMSGFIGISDDIKNAGFEYSTGTIQQNRIITSDHYRENHIFMEAVLSEYLRQ